MIKLLVMIYNNEKKLKNILKKYKLNFNVMTYGSGTASLSLLTYFGLDKVKKSLYFSLIPSSLEKKVLQELETKLNLKQIGEGIGFTISLTSSNKFIKDILDKEGDMMENKDEYELIINPNINYVLQNTSQQFSVYLYKNGIKQDDAVSFLDISSGIPAGKYTIIVDDDNSFTLYNNGMYMNSPVVIKCVSGTTIKEFNIMLRGLY